MYTIATAGHIDHGKSSLVRALTGIDPDRLPEEKARQMTIELGFAHFRLSNAREVGIIDVPGHERFIKTMISGVGALDLVLFVVAADDGWMPQSEEHLAILRHLGVARGIIILTKVDLVEYDWTQLVKADLRQKTAGTFLENCPLIEFSALDNRNLGEIRSMIESSLLAQPLRQPGDSARLFVDRIFSVAGTGTVVTGTLREGRLRLGQEVSVHPSGAGTRVKNLESFYSKLEAADPGIRLAVGLQSLEKLDLQRGDVIYYPAELKPGGTIGVKLAIEPLAQRFVKNGRAVTLLHGTGEIEGTLHFPPETPLFDESVVAVLKLERATIFKSGDHFILRLSTPSRLIGGGQIIDPDLENYRRKDTEMWSRLGKAVQLTVTAAIEYDLSAKKIVSRERLLFQTLYSRAEINSELTRLIARKEVVDLSGSLILSAVWQSAMMHLLSALGEFHAANPHQAAVSLAELKSRTRLPGKLIDLAIDQLLSEGKVIRRDSGIKLSSYAAGLSDQQEQLRRKVVALLSETKVSCLTRDELFALDKEARKVYTYLRQNDFIVDADGTVYLKEVFEEIANLVLDQVKARGRVTVAEIRDSTGSSRKVVLPILEELDRRKITRRDGDYRILWQ